MLTENRKQQSTAVYSQNVIFESFYTKHISRLRKHENQQKQYK